MYFSEIIATGSAVPEKIIPNTFFSSLVDNPDEWISSRTGIKERRFAEETVATSDLAGEAAVAALKNGGINPDEIDCIIVGTSTPDMSLPATACMVQKSIGATNAFAFDLNAVCSSFIFALETADNFIKSGKYRTILVIGADTYSKILDFQDKTTSPLFGDGAGAAIVRRTTEKKGILQTIVKSDGRGWDLIQVPSSGSRKPVTSETIAARANTFMMEGKKVYVFATDTIPRLINDLIAQAGMTPDQIDFIIPHQANVRIIDTISKKNGIPQEKFLMNLHKYGNTAAASVPLVLDEYLRSGTIKPGHRLLMLGFGGGLSWGGMLVQF